jgi:uncharacterized protein
MSGNTGAQGAPEGRSRILRRNLQIRESEAKLTGELAFFELGVEDAERGRAFYSELFGWRFEPGPGDGFVIGTEVPGGMHGGDPGGSPYLFFAVDDIEAAVDRVRELGGTIDELDVGGDEETVARFGHFRICRDDQGSPFGLHQRPRGS